MSLKVNRNGNFQVGNTTSGGSPASGTIEITKNGVYDVSTYATADVDVEQGAVIDEDYTISSGTLTNAVFTAEQGFTAYIPNGVTMLGNKAFQYNTLITNIEMTNSVLTIESGAVFGPAGYGCFYCCSNLTNIKLSENLTSIGDFAFKNCTSLTTITIPISVTSVGSNSFEGCTKLTSIVIGNGVTSIASYAFNDCTSLTDIYYTGTQAEWEQITFGDKAIPAGATIHYEYTP